MTPNIETPEAQRYLKYAMDEQFTQEMARVFGNDDPAPVKHAFFDRSLENTGVLAYYVNPGEVVDLCPENQRPQAMSYLQQEFGTLEPYMGLNPKLLEMDEKLVYSAIKHEQGHGAQPKGKLALKGIYAHTTLGDLPLGEMFIEGWNEYGLERKGEQSPSQYFDKVQGRGTTLYSQYRDFVSEVEQRSPGITRQIVRAAKKGGPNAAMRLIETIPDIDKLVTRYAERINYRMN